MGSRVILTVFASITEQNITAALWTSNKLRIGVVFLCRTPLSLKLPAVKEPSGLMRPQNNDTKPDASILHDERDKAPRGW